MKFRSLIHSSSLLRALNWALWGVFLISLGSLAWPLGQRAWERVEGWNAQRQLKQEWQRAAQQAHAEAMLVSLRPHPKHRSDGKTRHAAKKHPAVPRPPRHWPLTRLIIPRINLDAAVVQGIDAKALLLGPGHDPATSAPGQGNCVIAAHRNMAGWWFYHLNKMSTGDVVTLATPGQLFRYRVQTVRRVPDKNTSLLRVLPGRPARLTLYSCTLPKTKDRLTVVAQLQRD